MRDELVSFETAKLARTKGFIVPTWHFYEEGDLYTYSSYMDWNEGEEFDGHNDPRYNAPTQSLLQRWLRETHKLCITITFGSRSWDGFGYYHGDVHRGGDGLLAKINWEGEKDKFRGAIPIKNLTYEEALEEGLKEALKLIILQSK